MNARIIAGLALIGSLAWGSAAQAQGGHPVLGAVIGGGAVNGTYAIFVKGARKQQLRSLSANAIPWAQEERSIVIEFGDSRSNAEAGVITGISRPMQPTARPDHARRFRPR